MKNFFQNTETISKIINFFRGEKRFPKVETISKTRNEIAIRWAWSSRRGMRIALRDVDYRSIQL